MHRRAFTLIELLVVIAIVAAVSIAVVVVLNPSEIFRKGRDSVRLLDIKTISDSVFAYEQSIGGSLGSSSVTYVSIPDPTATSSAGTDCSGLGFFVGGGSFHCAASSTYRESDGTGWIPLNLAKPTYDSAAILPVDPVNTTSSNHYYIYRTDGSTYEVMAAPESQTYSAPTYATDFTRGTNPGLGFGTYLSQFGSSGSGNGQFISPSEIAFDSSGNIYVVDGFGNNRVQKVDSNGNYVSPVGLGPGSGNGQFNYPIGIAVDSSGNIYVTDSSNNRVQKFDSSGAYVSQFGSSGSGNGQFSWPSGIAFDSSGNIYVVDSHNNRVQKFDSSGAYVSQFGSTGTGDGQFENGSSYAVGIAIDGSGNIYVTDNSDSRIEKFNSSGSYLSQFGSFGAGDGQLGNTTAEGIAIDSRGNIYVTDGSHSRVEKFDPSGKYIAQFGSHGTGNGQLASYVTGIAIDANGNLNVADSGNARIQKFTSGN